MEYQPTLTYNEMGEGVPVVLVHGFCETKDLWRDFMPKLSQKYRVIAVDLPGFGENPPIEHPLTIGDMAESLYQLLQFLQVDQSIIIGHSLGGYVALAYAEKFPQRIKGLSLFHSTALSDTFEKKQARNKTIDFIERYGINEFVEEFVPPLFYEGRKKDLKEEIKWVTDMGKNVDKVTIIETIKAMRDRKDRTKVLEKAPFPVQFIVGRNDVAIPFGNMQAQFGIPAESTIHVLPNLGHMGMLEQPDQTLRFVMHFVSDIIHAD